MHTMDAENGVEKVVLGKICKKQCIQAYLLKSLVSINFREAVAIMIKVVSRYSKAPMCY